MPYHDLNLLNTNNTVQLNHTLAFATELGYKTIAISSVINGKIPPNPTAPDLGPLRSAHPDLKLFTRLTLSINDTSQNHRLATLQPLYDIVSLRPLNEKSLQHCCSTLECDLISIDFSTRLPFLLKFKTVSSALQRGIRFEINYSPITSSSDAKRNLIAGATALIRATRGRGIILGSEARNALGLRGPHDVMNLAQIWGLEQAKGKEALVEEADKVARLAALRRNSYRGVVSVVHGGKSDRVGEQTSQEAAPAKDATIPSKSHSPGDADKQATVPTTVNGVKRKASTSSLNQELFCTPASVAASVNGTPNASTSAEDQDKPISKREQKRRAKKARLEARGAENRIGNGSEKMERKSGSFPLRHEELDSPKNQTQQSPHHHAQRKQEPKPRVPKKS